MFKAIEPEAERAAAKGQQAQGPAATLRSAVGDINARQQAQLNQDLANYGTLISRMVRNSNQEIDILQGFVAEIHHTQSYNVEAAARGDLAHKSKLAPAGDKTTDILTERVGGRTVESQVKFFDEPKNTASALSKTRYTEKDVDKVAPQDQIAEIRRISRTRSAKNRTSDAERSRNYKHSAEKTKDYISHPDKPDIKSDPITRRQSEELTKAARDREIDYPARQRKQTQLQKTQYANAAKAGAIGGAVYSTAGEVIRLMQRRGELRQEDLEQALYSVLVGTAKGAGGALLTTAVQHAGRAMSEKAAGASMAATVGRSLGKGHIAPLVASIAMQFAQDVGRMCNGEIDGIEMVESTINGACQGVAGAAGYALGLKGGTVLWPYVATMIGQNAASATAFGMSMGALGPVVAGMAGGALAAMAVGAYINHCQQKGVKLAVKDLTASFDAMQCGQLDLVGYVGDVGKMSKLRFAWGDLLPLHGSFAVFGEYKVRKAQLQAMKKKIESARADLPSEEREVMLRMHEHYQNQVRRIEAQIAQHRNELLNQFDTAFENVEHDLNTYLSVQHKLFVARNVNLAAHLSQLHRSTVAGQQERAQTAEATNCVEAMLTDLERHDGGLLSQEQRTLMRQALNARLSGLLPHATPADLVQQFMANSNDSENAV